MILILFKNISDSPKALSISLFIVWSFIKQKIKISSILGSQSSFGDNYSYLKTLSILDLFGSNRTYRTSKKMNKKHEI